ncbi:MAG: hypothetical protein U0519_03770 [Candidatus Gracilibacteria bacterium]
MMQITVSRIQTTQTDIQMVAPKNRRQEREYRRLIIFLRRAGLPGTIKYSGYGNDPGIYEIQFHHTQRDNPVTSALSGYCITTAYLIDCIDVYVNLQEAALVRTYEFTQENNNNAAVTHKSNTKNGEEAFPLIQFTYFEGNENAQLKQKSPQEKLSIRPEEYRKLRISFPRHIEHRHRGFPTSVCHFQFLP